MTKEAMKLALVALEMEEAGTHYPTQTTLKAIAVLREALAKPDFWEGYVPEPTVKQSLTVEQPAQQEPLAPAGDPFLQGVCVALQTVTVHGDGVMWREIVETVGVDEILQYAAHIEPEEWELAGFSVFTKSEMGRDKPKSYVEPIAQQERPSFADWTSDHVRDNLHKLKPQPVQQDIPDLIAGALGVSRGTAYDMMREALKDTSPEPLNRKEKT